MAKLNEIPYSDLEERGKCGSGTFSQVYRAFWKAGNRIVALKKFLRLQVAEEAEVLSQLSHRNIVKFIGLVSDPRVCGIVTEYIENGSLYDFLHGNADHARANQNNGNNHQANNRGDELNFSLLVTLASDVSCGMNYLHVEAPVQVVHHDLKSKNVLLTSAMRCKICDFGSAQLGVATSRSSLAGTYAWMAPEVMKNEPFTEKCDVWSFGVVVWELTTREVPFEKLRGEQILWNVAYRGERLPIGLNCPADLAELMRVCWRDEESRPSFSVIQSRLAEMAGNSQLVASANTFMADRAAFARENEAFRQRLLDFERDLQHRNTELAARAERLRLRENELEQQFKVPKLEDYDVNMWRDIDVYEWIKHLRVDSPQNGFFTVDQLVTYANHFLQHNITGDQLLKLTLSDMDRLGIKSVGHQKAIRERITVLSRENRLNQHFPTLASTTSSISLPSPLGAAPDRLAGSPQFVRLTFVFGMHLVECRNDGRTNHNPQLEANSTGEEVLTDDANEPIMFKFKMFADVLEDEREPSVAAPMFLVSRVEFRYEPSVNTNNRNSSQNNSWKVQIDRPPYVMPDWKPLQLPTPPHDSVSTAPSSGTSSNAEFVFPDGHVTVRIEFWSKYVRRPGPVEHRHPLVFERARVRCTSHDIEAAANERGLPFKHRRKSQVVSNVVVNGNHASNGNPAQHSVHHSFSSSQLLSPAPTQSFQAQRKFVKCRLVPNYSEMNVTLELQQAARNAAGDFAAELRNEQAIEAQEEVGVPTRHLSRVDVTDVLDTVYTTTGTVYSCASPMSSTRISTPCGTSREHPASLLGYYPPSQAAVTSASFMGVEDPFEKVEKMTYARAAARNPPVNRAAPPQLTLSNSRSKANLNQLSVVGTYQASCNAPSSSNASMVNNNSSLSTPNNWARVATARPNSGSFSPLAATGGYQSSHSPSFPSPLSSTTNPSARYSANSSAKGANRDGLSLDLNSESRSSNLVRNSPAVPTSTAALLRPVSAAVPGPSRAERAEAMVDQGLYRTALSNELVLNINPALLSNQIAQAVAQQQDVILSPASEIETSAATTQTDKLHITCDVSTQTNSFNTGLSGYPASVTFSMQRTTSSSSMPQEQRIRGARRGRGRGRQPFINSTRYPIIDNYTTSSNAHVDQSYNPRPVESIPSQTCTSNVNTSLAKAVDAAHGDLCASLASTISASSRKSNTSESTTTTSDTLTQPSAGDDDQDVDGFESAASTLSTETTLLVVPNNNQRSQPQSHPHSELTNSFARVRLNSSGDHSDRVSSPPFSLGNRSSSDVSAMQVSRGPRRRRTRKSHGPPSRSDDAATSNADPADDQVTDSADWHTVSRKPRLKLVMPVSTRREAVTNAMQERLRSNFALQSSAADSASASQLHCHFAPTSPTAASARPTLAYSASNPNLFNAHSLAHTASKDLPRTTEQHPQQGAPSTPSSPTPNDAPPGLLGPRGPFRGVSSRNRHSSQSEREANVSNAHHERDRDRQIGSNNRLHFSRR